MILRVYEYRIKERTVFFHDGVVLNRSYFIHRLVDMESSFITGMAALLGSLTGASASIVTAWMTQRNQLVRERAKSELRRREALYGEFISEVSRLTADAFEHSLERPDILVNVYAIAGRIQLIASAPVMKTADECCRYIVDLYSRPNMTIEQIRNTLQLSEHPLRVFETACRAELNHYVI